MSMNNIQFQPGLSMPEFIQQYGTETQCEEALVRTRWPKGFCCPKCEHTDHCVLHSKKRLTFQCNTCHHQASLPDCQYIVSGDELTFDSLVSGDLFY